MKDVYYDFGYDTKDQRYYVKLYAGYNTKESYKSYDFSVTQLSAALELVNDLRKAGVTQRHRTDD